MAVTSSQLVEVQNLEIMPPDDFSIRLGRDPATLVKEAGYCAKALLSAVKVNGWATNFGGKKDHLWFEAWSFLAAMYRCTPRVRVADTKYVVYGDTVGFEAVGEAFHIQTQTVIGTASSMCLDDEENWCDRPVKEWDDAQKKKVATGRVKPVPLFQLRSMAETRAQAKALRGPFSWIIAMAGYAPRPAEEMSGNEPGERGGGAKGTVQQPQQKQSEKPETNGSEENLISANQAKRIWGIGFSYNVPKEKTIEILKAHGFEDAAHVTKDKYEAVVADVEKAAVPK